FVAIVLNLPFFRPKKNPHNPIFKYASIYGNVGFMAIPLAKAVLGAKGVFYCSSGLIAFNVITFTHGIRVMAGDQYQFDWKKLIVNPGVIGVAIGLPLFLLNVQVPAVVAQPISLIAGLNTAVAMLIFGTYLANTDLRTMFRAKGIYLVALLKLVALPVCCIFLFRLMGVKGSLLVACAISASVPSGNNTFMFSSKYGLDVGMASKTVALVSFISIFTMPVIIAFAQSMA
ncbi:MAG: AEC family transporter, partial [Clostridia bacterium]|nr:AEC family transporter [Clostridia bacterium]